MRASRNEIRQINNSGTKKRTRDIRRCAVNCLFIASWVTLFPIPAWCTGVIAIPSESDPNYTVVKHESSQAAPPGYEGRTDTSTETAIGKAAATAGKTIKASFTLGNQIRTCPLADGTAEGTGVFSVSVDYIDAQTNGTSTTHIEMRANAKYKGQVGDDALLHGPVNAEIDFTYNQTGSFRNTNGAITNTPPSNVQQHITIPFVVGRMLEPPSIGPFSGGDPLKGHYADAYGVGTALAYWAGIYYAVAELKWYGGDTSGGGTSVHPGQCAQIVFDPPSNASRPPLGTQVKVNAKVRSKAGEETKAKFVEVHAYSPGNVLPAFGLSDLGKPMQFTYTAPNQNAKNAGFSVGATSRAGAAEAEWHTGLGTGWSGELYYENSFTGDEGNYPDSQWSNSSLTTVTVTVANGVAMWHGHIERKGFVTNWQPVFHAAHRLDTSSTDDEMGDGEAPASVQVFINETAGTYEIKAGALIGPDGKSPWFPGGKSIKIGEAQWSQCNRTSGCKSGRRDLLGLPSLPALSPMSGKVKDSNHIEASYTGRKEHLGDSKNGVMIETMTVNLSRSGSK